MAAPTSYTESTLRDYLITEVMPDVATKLGWDTDSPEVLNAVNEAMLCLAVDDLAEFTTLIQIRKLRAFARREIWRQAAQVTAHKINLTADGATVSLAELHKQCKAMYSMAAQEVLDEWGGNVTGEDTPSVVVSRRDCPCDPYVPVYTRVTECEE